MATAGWGIYYTQSNCSARDSFVGITWNSHFLQQTLENSYWLIREAEILRDEMFAGIAPGVCKHLCFMLKINRSQLSHSTKSQKLRVKGSLIGWFSIFHILYPLLSAMKKKGKLNSFMRIICIPTEQWKGSSEYKTDLDSQEEGSPTIPYLLADNGALA